MNAPCAAAAIATAAIVLAGCAAGSSTATDSAGASVQPTPEVTVTVTATPSPAADTQSPATSAPQPATDASTATPSKEPKSPKPKAAPKIITVPDAVGMNYQRAQDLWRSKGLIVLPAKDASGQDRWALLDSNWYVVAQTPAAGTQINDGGTIRASILKYGD
jgi:hypothetical protein